MSKPKRDNSVRFMCNEGHRNSASIRELVEVKVKSKGRNVDTATQTRHLCRTCAKPAFPVAYHLGSS
jgi:hypothetical protein